MNELILSVFPGIDLLGRGFEDEGYCIVQAQDLITGGDIRRFNPPPKKFDGIIGGSPCQDFSRLNRTPKNYSYEMLEEYRRVVKKAQPKWFLHENVQGCPEFSIDGYHHQRFILDLGWFTENSRLRVFTFGSKNGELLNPITSKKASIKQTAITGKDKRSFQECCEIQGLTKDFDLPFFNLASKKQAVANAVPLDISKYLAKLIKRDYYKIDLPIVNKEESKNFRKCLCGCGREVFGRKKTSSDACRKRVSRSHK